MDILELNGYLEQDGARQPFLLRISEQRSAADLEEFSCLVHAPQLFESDKTIYGIDSEQAWTLAVKFVASILGGRRIIDSTGKLIILEEM